MTRPLLRTLIGFLCTASMAMGATAYGTSAAGELTGSRDLTNVTVSGSFSLFEISWVITLTNGIYHYVYTITGPSGPGLGISHFALNLGGNCVAGGSCVTNATMNAAADESLLIYGAN